MINAYCNDLYPQLVFNWDAVTLKYGNMMDGDEIERVLIYSDDYRHLKQGGILLKLKLSKVKILIRTYLLRSTTLQIAVVRRLHLHI